MYAIAGVKQIIFFRGLFHFWVGRYNKTFNDRPHGNSEFCFPSVSIEGLGETKALFPWDQWLSVYRFVLQECVATLMNLLAECVNAMKKEDIKSYQSNLFTLFLEALDFRAHHDQEASVKYFRTMWR